MGVLSIGQAPKTNDGYYWADYLELLCLASQSNTASVNDAAKEVKSQSDDSIDSELFLDAAGVHSPEFKDKAIGYAEDGLSLAKNRGSMFGENYPFDVSFKEKELSLKPNLTFEQRLYIALLLCSNHRYCASNMDVFTLGFEKISKYALKGLMPSGAVVKHLGTRQGMDQDAVESDTNRILDKIKAVCADLSLTCIADEEDFSENDTGDGGLDLIGFIPMPEPGLKQEIVYLAQSTTTKIKSEIDKKQNDASNHKWKNRIKFVVISINILFLAASIRQQNGKFIKGINRHSDAIWIDRSRIIAFIRQWRERSANNAQAPVIPENISECIDQLVA